MLAKVAVQIIAHEKGKYGGAVFGVVMAVSLVLLQFGFYLGFRRDITVVPDSFEADLWLSQRSLLTFDCLAHIDDLVLWQVLEDRDVQAATESLPSGFASGEHPMVLQKMHKLSA